MRARLRAVEALRPKAIFRVYCDRARRGKFYQVIIVRSDAHVRRAARLISGQPRGWVGTLGWCTSLQILDSHDRQRPLTGYVVLAENRIGSGYVSHELTHAAHFRLIRAWRGRFASMQLEDDRLIEPLADLQGWLVAQFWTEFYRRFPGTPIELSLP